MRKKPRDRRRVFNERNLLHRFARKLTDDQIAIGLIQKALKKEGVVITDKRNISVSANKRASIAAAEMEKYNDKCVSPISSSIVAIAETTGWSIDAVKNYILLESALERELSDVKILPSLNNEKEAKYATDEWSLEYAAAVVVKMREALGEKADAMLGELWNRLNAAHDWSLHRQVRAGQITQEDIVALKSHGWQYYMPMQDWDIAEEGFDSNKEYDYQPVRPPQSQKGGIKVKTHKAEGRLTKPFDPFANMVAYAYKVILTANTNEVNQTLYRLAMHVKHELGPEVADKYFHVWKVPYLRTEGGFVPLDPTVEIDKDMLKRSAAVGREIKAEKGRLVEASKRGDMDDVALAWKRIKELEPLEEVRMTPNSRFDKQTPQGFDVSRMPNVVDVYVGGVRNMIELVDPAVARAINGGQVQLGKLWEVTIGALTRYHAASFTARNPTFLPMNAIRDLEQAMTYHFMDPNYGSLKDFTRHYLVGGTFSAIGRAERKTAKPLTNEELGAADITKKTDRGALTAVYGKKRVEDTLYDLYVMNGGKTGFVHMKEVERISKDFRKMLARETKIGKTAFRRGTENAVRPVLRYMRAAAEKSEISSRYATFKASLDKGKTAFQATQDAKEITVNFNRRGEWSRVMGATYMFFNASVQGTATHIRFARQNPLRFAAYATTRTMTSFFWNMAIDAVIQGALGDEDEGDWAITRWIRGNYLAIPIGKQLITLPRAHGFRFFGMLGAILYDNYSGRLDTDDMPGEIAAALLDEGSPLPAPQKGSLWRTITPSFFTPYMDNMMNEDAFGRPLAQTRYSDVTPHSESGFKSTPQFLTDAARWLNRQAGGNEFMSAGIDPESGKPRFWRGQLFDQNPNHWKHLGEFYAGGMGKFILNLWSVGEGIVSGNWEDINLRQVPFAGDIVRNIQKQNPSEEYKNRREALKNLHTIYNNYVNTNDPRAKWPANLAAEVRYDFFKWFDKDVSMLYKALEGVSPQDDKYSTIQAHITEVKRMSNYIDKKVDWTLPHDKINDLIDEILLDEDWYGRQAKMDEMIYSEYEDENIEDIDWEAIMEEMREAIETEN